MECPGENEYFPQSVLKMVPGIKDGVNWPDVLLPSSAGLSLDNDMSKHLPSLQM